MRTAEKNNWKRESINLPSSIKLGAKIVATVAGFYLWGGLYMGGFGRGFLLEYPKEYRILPFFSHRSDRLFLVFIHSHFLKLKLWQQDSY